MAEVATIDRQIAAIKNSAEYRRLVTAHRGPREEKELSKLNLQIAALQNRRTVAEAKHNPQPHRHAALLPPKADSKKKGGSVENSAKKVEEVKQPARKILTFAPVRPLGLKPPAARTGVKPMIPAAANMVAPPKPEPEHQEEEDVKPLKTAEIKAQAGPKTAARQQPKMKTNGAKALRNKPKAAVLKDNVKELELDLDELTEEL
jgi:hypothetical protein